MGARIAKKSGGLQRLAWSVRRSSNDACKKGTKGGLRVVFVCVCDDDDEAVKGKKEQVWMDG